MARPRCSCCGRALPSPRLPAPRVILDQPQLRIARRLVWMVERHPRGLFRSDLHRGLNSADRRWLSEAITYALARDWLRVQETFSPRTGKLFARLFLLGDFVPPEPTQREQAGVRRRKRRRKASAVDDEAEA